VIAFGVGGQNKCMHDGAPGLWVPLENSVKLIHLTVKNERSPLWLEF
jgi:hypothetical protein